MGERVLSWVDYFPVEHMRDGPSWHQEGETVTRYRMWVVGPRYTGWKPDGNRNGLICCHKSCLALL